MKDDTNNAQQVQVSVNLDTTPILYTDNINITANPDGIVLDIMQRVGPSNQVRIVARVGMSREHAKKVVESLGKMLMTSEATMTVGKKLVN